MQRGHVVIVCGLIGSGKSTLSKELAVALGPDTLWLHEPDEHNGENPFLADYYSDAKRWALTMQLHLLGLRYRRHLRAQWHALDSGHDVVLDSSYYQDTAFAQLQLKLGLMDQREFSSYCELYRAMTAAVLLPTVCVRILVDPEVCAHRIAGRMEKQVGRRCESGIDLGYLRGLDEEIGAMVTTLRQQDVVVLDMPWDCDRDTPDMRAHAVHALAARISALHPTDLLSDAHRRTA